MKPTLEEIKFNYSRVLLRLHSGELAGIVKDVRPSLQVLRKTHWKDREITTADLDKSYNRTNPVTNFNIDAIAIMNDAVEVDYYINNYDPKDIGWDWDINNPHNLKFKKGDVVKICKSESRIYYDQMRGRIGTIVDAEYTQDVDDERITYRVRVDGHYNEYQNKGLWVFHDEKSLELYNTQNDDKMDTYKFDVVHTRYSIDDILKGDNNMNNILEIYESRKANKLFEETKAQIEKVKMADPTYKAWKTAVDTINKIYAKDIARYGEICPIEPKLSEKSEEKMKELNSSYSNQRRDIDKEIEEIKAQLSICETYEQKQNVLKLYNVIDADGKINA